jgi:voltage-gated potassium channel
VAATSRPLDVLGLIFLLDFVAAGLVPGGPSWWAPSVTIISVVVWVAFVIDYVVRFTLSPHRRQFVRTHPLDLLMVVLPMLRVLRAILLLRRSFRSISTERIAGSLLAIVGVVVVCGAVLEFAVEHNAPGANITTIGLSFWWAIVTTTTVGYGDTYPVTPIGRLIASVIMLVGIGLIGTVSATVAAWFVKHRPRDGKASEPQPPENLETAVAELTEQVRQLTAQQAALQQSIDRLSVPPG